MYDDVGQRRILFHLCAIHPEPDHSRRPDMRRQMRPPTAHQIEDRAALRQNLRVNLADLSDRAVIDMRDESRDRVKYLIIVVIDAPEEIGRKLFSHREILFWRPEDSSILPLNINYLGQFFEKLRSLLNILLPHRLNQTTLPNCSPPTR